TNVVAIFLNSTNDWNGLVDDVSATNCALHVEDFLNTRPVQLDISQVALSLNHFSNLPRAKLTLGVSARWDTNGTVRVDGEGALSPPAIDLQLALNELELRPLDPYLEPIADILIFGSKLSVDGRARVRTTDSGLPAMTF